MTGMCEFMESCPQIMINRQDLKSYSFLSGGEQAWKRRMQIQDQNITYGVGRCHSMRLTNGHFKTLLTVSVKTVRKQEISQSESRERKEKKRKEKA